MLRRFLNWLQGTGSTKLEKSTSAETKRTPRNLDSAKAETRRTSRSYGADDCYGSGVTWVNMSTLRNKDKDPTDKKSP